MRERSAMMAYAIREDHGLLGAIALLQRKIDDDDEERKVDDDVDTDAGREHRQEREPIEQQLAQPAQHHQRHRVVVVTE